MTPTDRLALALDVPSADAAWQLVEATAEHVGVYKVGMQLFYAEGADLVRRIKAIDKRVFLDLKLHDIPNTVAAALRSLAPLAVDYLTVHASGGAAMLGAAAEAAGSTRLLAVTVLTSMDREQMQQTGLQAAPADQVLRLAQMAQGVGVSGLVCSALEARRLRQALGSDAFLVCPGIRPAGAERDDQRRVATPAAAIADGADLLVVGRPISRANDPALAAQAIVASMA